MSLTLGRDALDTRDWSALLHAYGWAIDTPAHLRALRSDELKRLLADAMLDAAALKELLAKKW